MELENAVQLSRPVTLLFGHSKQRKPISSCLNELNENGYLCPLMDMVDAVDIETLALSEKSHFSISTLKSMVSGWYEK